HHRIEKIRAAAEHARAPLGPAPDHVASAHQVVDTARLDVREPHALAAGGREVCHLVGAVGVELQVVERGDGAHATAEARVAGDVADALAVEPDLTVIPQAFEVRGAATRTH